MRFFSRRAGLQWCALLAVLVLARPSPLSITVRAQAAVPSPEQFFGHRMGADRMLANWDRLLAYYRALDAASDKLTLVELGASSEGRPYVALFISSPRT